MKLVFPPCPNQKQLQVCILYNQLMVVVVLGVIIVHWNTEEIKYKHYLQVWNMRKSPISQHNLNIQHIQSVSFSLPRRLTVKEHWQVCLRVFEHERERHQKRKAKIRYCEEQFYDEMLT